jgi:alanine-synthesizing transaminase
MIRRNIVHEGTAYLTYEIREMVEVANHLKSLGMEITWENIGDPVNKGEKLPEWIKEIVRNLVLEDHTYAYVATQGIPETRQFLAEQVNRLGGCQITADDVLFYNGLGDAVARIFGLLRHDARVIGPSPGYSTHGSSEAFHAASEHLTYRLDPYNDWHPDINELEQKIRSNNSITGILIINPNNPTGSIYPLSALEQIIRLAQKYHLFVMCDEIYTHIIYEDKQTARLCEKIGTCPGMALRGISKEYPWPGSRCGWIEIYNQDRHPVFQKYVQSLISAKRLEVCSTSLPQYSIPLIMGDPRYPEHLEKRRTLFEKRTHEAFEIFSRVEGIAVNKAKGAFYMSILFEPGRLNNKQCLQIENNKVKTYIEKMIPRVAPDKRFVYYLLAATGICVVPLTGFFCDKLGFRVTLLECNDEKRRWTWETIARCITEYLAS